MLLIKPIHILYFHCLALSMLVVRTLLPMDNPYKNIVQEIEAAIQNQDQSVALLEQLANKCGGVHTLVAQYQQQSLKGSTPLHFAVSFCDENAEKYTANPIACSWFLDHGVDVGICDKNGRTPLHNVCTAECAELLIKHGANIEAIEQKEGYTPLHDAASSGIIAVVNVLLKHKANVNSRMLNESTPLHVACSVATAQALIKAGADIHAQDTYTGEPIHYTARYSIHNPEILAVLVNAGATINTPGHNGNTPLHFAVKKSNERAVKWLLEHGASTKILNKDNWGNNHPPMHYALEEVELRGRGNPMPGEGMYEWYQRALRILVLLAKYQKQ